MNSFRGVKVQGVQRVHPDEIETGSRGLRKSCIIYEQTTFFSRNTLCRQVVHHLKVHFTPQRDLGANRSFSSSAMPPQSLLHVIKKFFARF